MMTEKPTKVESAPSRLHADEPTIARWAGGIGWGIVFVGLAIVAANRVSETPRLFPESTGWLAILIGTTMALIHASLETDLLLRRILGGIGAALVLASIAWGIALTSKQLSWGPALLAFVPGLLLIVLYLFREMDQEIRQPALLGFGGTALALAVIGVIGTIVFPQGMPARWSVAFVIGILMMLVYLGLAGISDKRAFQIAWASGVLGAVAIGDAIIKSILLRPSYVVLVEAGLGVLFSLIGIVLTRTLGKGDESIKSTRMAVKWGWFGLVFGVSLAVVGLVRFFGPIILARWIEAPGSQSYLVPTGIIQIIAGGVFAFIAAGFLSENQLIVLTRRELTVYFVSPIAYCVMAGFVLMAAQAYHEFLLPITYASENQLAIEEPIIQRYVINFLQVVALMAAVPLITMRLFSEEKRTGTLEVLLTAPVNDWLIVLSKFLAVWIFFILLWLPWWTLLLGLRLEGGQEFDFRPMIGFLLALVACGAAFTAMGMFFSSLTRDQIISAALTFMGMMFLVGFFFLQRELRGTDQFTTAVKTITRGMSFIHMWIDATQGKLYMRDVVYQLCAAVFWLFATVKVLEFRRWS